MCVTRSTVEHLLCAAVPHVTHNQGGLDVPRDPRFPADLGSEISSCSLILRLFKMTEYDTLLGFPQQKPGFEILRNIPEDGGFDFFV